MKLSLSKPAQVWQQALPLGNGRIGAMIHGQPFIDRIQINEESLWSGTPTKQIKKTDKKWQDELYALVDSGDVISAEQKIKKDLLGYSVNAYMPFGDVIVTMQNTKGEYRNFSRELDLDTAISTVKYNVDGEVLHANAWASDALFANCADTEVTKTSFTSFADDVFIMQINTSTPHAIELNAHIVPFTDCKTYNEDHNTIVVEGCMPEKMDVSDIKGVKFPQGNDTIRYCARLKIVADWVNALGSNVNTAGNNTAMIIFSIASSYNGYDKSPVKDGKDCKKIAKEKMDNALKYSFEELMERHVKAYQEVYSTMSFKLDCTDEVIDVCSLRERAKQGKDVDKLTNVTFNYGRYLLVCSSYNCEHPATLQGIWNNHLVPAWDCDYHTNINLQMNYWGANASGLGKCLSPLFDLLKDFSVAGVQTARDVFLCKGWSQNNNSDVWRHTAPCGVEPVWAYFPLGGLWLAREIWVHYQYTLDKGFLEDYFPVLEGAVEFALDYMVEKDGYLTTPVSTSPENTFYKDGKRACICQGSAMDLTIISDALNYMITVCEDLGKDATVYETALKKLKPLSIASDGRLLEWDKEYEEIDKGHRHFSHLLGLYPYKTIEEDSPYYKACKKSVETRLTNGGGATGWSNLWSIGLLNRCNLKDLAYDYMQRQVAYQTMENLFDKHGRKYYDCFQIDGNLGLVSCVCDMLADVVNGKITLLPYLPEQWKKGGEVKGIRLKGAKKADFTWKDGKITKYVITDLEDKTLFEGEGQYAFPLKIY